VLMVFTQGYLIRKWMPQFGERMLLAVGLLLFAVSLFGIALSQTIAAMGVVMTILAIGNGLMRPPNLGMISLLTPADEQGAVLGVTNSLASLGRILGPVIGGILYERAGHNSPFVLAGGLTLLALVLIAMTYARLPISGKKEKVA
jgi:DHA1 family tetracycline resistance protein-like MFS transporter